MPDVTQADRGAAADLFGTSPWGREQWLMGKKDKDPRLARLARHRTPDTARIAALEEENARLHAVHTVNYELQRHMQTLVAGIHSAIEQLKILPYRCSKTEMIEQRLKKCLASKPATTAIGEQP